MPKTKVSYRLEDSTIAKLEKMAEFYSLHAPTRDDLPGQKARVTRTDVIEFIVHNAFEKLKEEYDI